MFDRTQQTLPNVDPEIWAAIQAENRRQEQHIELIASENYASPAVMAAQGSQLTNKYAEGYPGRRYYGGCEHVDVVEQLAIDRCKQLFGARHANVQPNSGSQANQAAFMALLQPGDTLLDKMDKRDPHYPVLCIDGAVYLGKLRRGQVKALTNTTDSPRQTP